MTKRTVKGSVLLLLIAAAAFWIWPSAAVRAQQGADALLLAEAARMSGTSAALLQVGDRFTQHFPHSGVTLQIAKYLNPETGAAYQVAIDERGRPAKLEDVEAEEQAVRGRKFGKIEPRLHALLTAAEASGPPGQAAAIPVAIWVNAPESPVQRSFDPDNGTAAAATLNQNLAALRQIHTTSRASVAATLKRMNANVNEAEYSPVIFAQATPGQLRQIARHPDVAYIYGAEKHTVFMESSATTHRAHLVWGGSYPNLGSGTSSRPVVHEDDGISDANPFLNTLTHPVLFWCAAVDGHLCNLGKNNVGSSYAHASEVAGVIASTHTLYRGIAPSAQLLLSANSQNLDDYDKDVHAFEWARGNGGDPVNMSWGTICYDGQTFMTKYVDWQTRNLWATTVISSGNKLSSGCAEPTNTNVSAPGNAWTAITVGSQYDSGDGFLGNDGMSSFSRYGNPPFATGMEKPEVVAVGQDVHTMYNASPWAATASGTSFSAPTVAGQVVQLLARRPGFTQWPEVNKAAVLMSAGRDLVAGTSMDGVGSVVMPMSDEAYRLGRYLATSVASTAAAGSTVATYQFGTLTAATAVRTAIAWDAWSTGGAGTDQLGADLDLYIYRNDTNALVSSSASVQNAWEVVSFTAPATTTYRAEVKLFSKVAGWPGTYLGLVWNVRSVPNFCSGMSSYGFSSVGSYVKSISTVNGGNFFNSYSGWPYTQNGREAIVLINVVANAAYPTRTLKITDTNTSMDLHAMKWTSCAVEPPSITFVSNADGAAATPLIISGIPASGAVYYVVVDGRSGYVGSDTVTFQVTTP